jgi:hypothetical protein
MGRKVKKAFRITGRSTVGNVVRSLKIVEEVEYAEPNYTGKQS